MKGYILRIEFVEIEPKVWRRVVMPSGSTFRRLHDTIQYVTNFLSTPGDDYHLYEFNLHKDNIRVTNDDFSYDQHKDFVKNKKEYIRQLMRSKIEFAEFEKRRIERLGIQVRKPSTIKIDKFIEEYGTIEYTYDFGDSWNMLVILEEIVDDYYFGYPTLLAGEGEAPPEDVGGVYGFYDFLKAYNDPSDEFYSEVRDWAKEQRYRSYDPDRINSMLKSVRCKKTEWDKINHLNFEVVEDKYRK
jgi:hypothetical protein